MGPGTAVVGDQTPAGNGAAVGDGEAVVGDQTPAGDGAAVGDGEAVVGDWTPAGDGAAVGVDGEAQKRLGRWRRERWWGPRWERVAIRLRWEMEQWQWMGRPWWGIGRQRVTASRRVRKRKM
ncbi:hypothetical protein ACKKBF_B21710 [Auxenochlorella protothecoides x Auxenochlorella symbiontica]